MGFLSSLCLLVLGGYLRMRSLQLALRNLWDFEDESVAVDWTPWNESTSCGGPTSATFLRESPWNPNIRTFCFGPTCQIMDGVRISWTNSSAVAGQRNNTHSRSISGNSEPFVSVCVIFNIPCGVSRLVSSQKVRQLCLTSGSRRERFHRLSKARLNFSVGRTRWTFLWCPNSS